MTPWIIAGASVWAGIVAIGWEIVRGGTMKPTPPITLVMEDGQEHHLTPPVTIDVSGLQTRLERAEEVIRASERDGCDMSDGCPPQGGEFCDGCHFGPLLFAYREDYPSKGERPC